MPQFDCRLDHHPLIRLSADSPEAAQTEYFRLYAIQSSCAPWECREVTGDYNPPLPTEPATWAKRRVELGTNKAPALLSPSEKVSPQEKPSPLADKSPAPSTPASEVAGP